IWRLLRYSERLVSVLAIAIPTVTNAATRAQVALRTVLEDFDSQFPEVRSLLERSLSRRMDNPLWDVVESGAELFPLETSSPILPPRLQPHLSRPAGFPIATPSPSLPTSAVALPVLQHPPEAMEEIEYMSNEQIFGFNPTVEEGEVDEEEDDGEGDRSSGMLTTAAVDNASATVSEVSTELVSTATEVTRDIVELRNRNRKGDGVGTAVPVLVGVVSIRVDKEQVKRKLERRSLGDLHATMRVITVTVTLELAGLHSRTIRPVDLSTTKWYDSLKLLKLEAGDKSDKEYPLATNGTIPNPPLVNKHKKQKRRAISAMVEK
ncbi:hypothetical protein BDP27DRAFT_1370001, partial [Rhodocollybia butyracea]